MVTAQLGPQPTWPVMPVEGWTKHYIKVPIWPDSIILNSVFVSGSANCPKMSFNEQQCKQPCVPPPCLQKTQEQCQAKAEEVCLPPCQDTCQEKCAVQAQEVCLPQCQELNLENCPQQCQDPCLPPCQDQCPPQCVEPCQEISQAKCVEVCPQKIQEKCLPPGKGK
uniref:Proline rich 9 n=2 Tax=Myotis TaxID=9434 RepID=A0A7J7SSP6_MYOMY|nr:proline rich 9 [Myotis myotis]